MTAAKVCRPHTSGGVEGPRTLPRWIWTLRQNARQLVRKAGKTVDLSAHMDFGGARQHDGSTLLAAPDLAVQVRELIMSRDTVGLKALRDCGQWKDLEMPVLVRANTEPQHPQWKFTSLALAACFKQLEVMQWLIEEGAKVDEIREWHKLPSNLAASERFIAGLELLNQKGCNFNLADVKENTPVHVAAFQNDLSTLRFFQSWGVALDTKNKVGKTPCCVAKAAGSKETADFLVDCRERKKERRLPLWKSFLGERWRGDHEITK